MSEIALMTFDPEVTAEVVRKHNLVLFVDSGNRLLFCYPIWEARQLI